MSEIEGFKLNREQVYNRNIFIYWNSGFDDAPDIVKLAFLMAKRLNPNYTVVFIDDCCIDKMFPYKEALFSQASIDLRHTLFSDVLRSYLICRYGGVWIDASCLLASGFSGWLDAYLEENDFFIFKSGSFHDRLIMSWFVAGQTNVKIIAEVLHHLVEFITKERETVLKLAFYPEKYCSGDLIGPRATDMRAIGAMESIGLYPYFVYHYLWNEVARRNSSFAASLDNLPKMPNHVLKFDRRKFTNTRFFQNQDGQWRLDMGAIDAEALFPPFLKKIIFELGSEGVGVAS